METNPLFKGIEILEGRARLSVSKDAMTVMVHPVDDDFNISLIGNIREFLSQFGISAQLLIPATKMEDHWIVARGIEPTPGEDGKIKILINTPQCHEEKDSNEANDHTHDEELALSGTLDPKEMGTIVNVKRGQRIAQNIPPTPGKPGKDIFGKEIPAAPGKQAAFFAGTGVKAVDNNSYLVATSNGKLHVDGDEISVLEVWEIDGPVDMSTGHISFWGKLLTIKGSVCSGFRVTVKGDLIVEGNAEDETTVEAGGNLHITGLIRAQKTVVTAGGNLRCSAVEYAEINAGRNIIVDDYLLDVTCRAGGNITIISNRGLIAGGKLYIGGSCKALKIGTEANVPTLIHAGSNHRLIEAYEQCLALRKKLIKKRNELQEAVDKIALMERQQDELTSKIAGLKAKITEGLSNTEIALDENLHLAEQMTAEIQRLNSATVEVISRAYPSCTICIADARLVLKKEVESAQFSFRKGQIVISTL